MNAFRRALTKPMRLRAGAYEHDGAAKPHKIYNGSIEKAGHISVPTTPLRTLSTPSLPPYIILRLDTYPILRLPLPISRSSINPPLPHHLQPDRIPHPPHSPPLIIPESLQRNARPAIVYSNPTPNGPLFNLAQRRVWTLVNRVRIRGPDFPVESCDEHFCHGEPGLVRERLGAEVDGLGGHETVEKLGQVEVRAYVGRVLLDELCDDGCVRGPEA
ncbi:uncharacterized protein M421DRAFT_112994 [Didymella exigua CBS 183.55]|uniref:Uncharacterized protein n=1 Tax=Didymella exigua CBS 183.55 TaxID=1150837 RepID=A0A6A5S055_9PLEO|nr:uncharacterized protein M421DRAFT_112994 [Didymella exigua CBS 183.55]KAF1934105.1 hypothetical protein M421DRAFT_112994 [Didymella exigua CBS 183.55]